MDNLVKPQTQEQKDHLEKDLGKSNDSWRRCRSDSFCADSTTELGWSGPSFIPRHKRSNLRTVSSRQMVRSTNSGNENSIHNLDVVGPCFLLP